ncbi:ABC transporter substrate-binding protein [Mycobacterium montefiorense]|uniref:Sugar ABC transporter substrate-binding lipoprotein UspC n=1 Tax=Mycobacterium montefiorense TaxID=154654 RepID=A0AA37PNR3_9MYCO|nr:sugar ABC transporter substrate-binding protein [Mycobacterium montefiorense]GBG40097.1 sugar ABC transporter substrate-binding lipoprotein UspC [Mycobacterium montefiorense]GKU36233.1 sugar ABC transporter substrate-binding lipoprotein UspC [Mycobacterium montefiorense]GKU38054.1 sugar ABC transporter substrate-binding lipoprotein UspC [Mycobacterium montefiorense]GKU45233.1 sugar ABC transporter substrate-binding lipoprotein UspC [Mycobacterium montefiorense]GKU52751.1 sugar ABC transport
MSRPLSSTLSAGALGLVAVLLATIAVLLNYSGEPHGNKIVVRVRVWDVPIAEAYRESFAAFHRTHPDIEVRVDLVAYSTYFNTLRTDVAGGSADDIFWLSNAYLAGYADNGRLLDVRKTLSPEEISDWEPAVVDQFTRGEALWGVPQLTDAGIAVYYNADLLSVAGIGHAQLDSLRWDPNGDDTLRPLAARLTVDVNANTAGTAGFDPSRIRQWGYNAANDAQAIYLNYIGSAGGVFQRGDEFAFDNPRAAAAFRYLVGLINDDHVAPPASDTNGNGDFSHNQFLAGRMALFQSGTYNLASIARDARFRWGVAMLPIGPAGRISVTNGIAAAGNSATKHPDAVHQVLAWMGSNEGNAYLGAQGAAIPAVLSAQQVYFNYWAERGVDVTPFFAVLEGPRIPAPGGAGFAAGNTALQGYFDEMFLGRGDVATTLRQAQAAANAAARR